MSDPGLTRRDVLKAGVTLAAAAHLGVGSDGRPNGQCPDGQRPDAPTRRRLPHQLR